MTAEARQICAICAIRLLLKHSNSNCFNGDDYIDAQKLYEQVSGMTRVEEAREQNAPIRGSTSDALVPLPSLDALLSYTEKKKLQSDINLILFDVLQKQIIKSDNNALVSLISPESKILESKQKAKAYEQRGTTLMFGGVALSPATIYFVGGLNGIGLLAVCFLGVAGGFTLCYKGHKLVEQP